MRASLIDIHFLNFKSLNLLADCSDGLLLEMSSPHFFLQGLAPGTNTLICGCGRQNRVGAGAWCGLCSAHSVHGNATKPHSHVARGSLVAAPGGLPHAPLAIQTRPGNPPHKIILIILTHTPQMSWQIAIFLCYWALRFEKYAKQSWPINCRLADVDK